MSFFTTTSKLTDLHHFFLFSHSPKTTTPSSIFRPFCTLHTTQPSSNNNKPSSSYTQKPAPWLNKWHPNKRPDKPDARPDKPHSRVDKTPKRVDENVVKGQNAMERIVLRLRNLGVGVDDDDGEEEVELGSGSIKGDEKLGDLLRREWIRPDAILAEGGGEVALLPWEKEEERVVVKAREGGKLPKRPRAPSLADLTLEDELLRRLRRDGMYLRERVSVPKAGVTNAVLEKIHDRWRKDELVRLKFHEDLAHDMKTAHELTERRTGGLVIWRSGSVMVVYRGTNYERPSSKSQPVADEGNTVFVPSISSSVNPSMGTDSSETSTLKKIEPALRSPDDTENLTEEETEFNSLLDGLGPRFVEWWGTGVLPVDADLLPATISGYKTPFRLLPTGMRSNLTNAEMTDLRKLGRSLPCHFALGRNRNHQGLAAAIVKLWEQSLIVKIAVKRGIQNTNNKLMADELKLLTGGTLLLRNKYYIVMYRGKDFLPPSVAAALAERQEMANNSQDLEEKVRMKAVEVSSSCLNGDHAPAGTLAEFREAQAQWGREISNEEREKMAEEAKNAQRARFIKRIESKLAIAQTKKLKAETLLAKIEKSMIPAGPDHDQETITDEERVMFRRVGLRMKAYLPLGIRGVFDGVIENMHLHWKHRELVKLISKQKTLAFVEDTGRLLEYESGGILVAIEKLPKGFVLIYYRGKNYRRPISLRPRNLLTKAKALKRTVAMQRHEALSQHIKELESSIDQMKNEIGNSEIVNDEKSWGSKAYGQLDQASEFSESEDDDEDENIYGEEDENDDSENEDIDFSDYEGSDYSKH